MSLRGAATLLLATVVLAGGCGYSTDSLLPAGIRTVAVDVFENDTFYREIEFDLTSELSEELRHRSHYTVARRRNADARITGRILSVTRPTLVESSRDLVSEQAVIVTARVWLHDSRNGGELMSFTLSNRAEFVVERGETLESAFAEALKDLAENIVNEFERQSFLVDMGVDQDAPEHVPADAPDTPR